MIMGTDLFAEMRSTEKPSGADMRAAIRVRSFRETEGEPMARRRTMAFAAVLDGLNPFLYEHDYLAGSMRSVFGAGGEVSEDDKQYLASIGERHFGTHADHVIIDFPRLLRLGFSGIRDEIANRLIDSNLTAEQRTELTAMDIALAAANRLLVRYAEACEKKMTVAEAPERKRWQQMAAQCSGLSERPPQSFHEAVQLAWFVHHILSVEGRGANGFGRIDQYLAPFYYGDLGKSIINPEDGQNLLVHLWAKIGERAVLFGPDDTVNIAIGGLTPSGEDGTNDLSFLCLRATRALQIPGPNLSARFHRRTPERFYRECIETIATGVGYPACFNDEVLIPSLESIGYPTIEARDYAMVGCIETFLPGLQPPWSDSRFNLPKCLELTLGNGLDLRTGEKRGLETGSPKEFGSFDDLLKALDAQIEFMVHEHAEGLRRTKGSLKPQDYTSPFMSSLMTDCVDRAKDINAGGTRHPSNHGIPGMGLGTITDSLAAIRKGIFQERRFTMEMLLEALQADFAGYEDLHGWIWNRAPKFGNDDPEADDLAVWVVETFSDATLSEKTYDGGRYLPLIAANVSNIFAGAETAATPDGRHAGAPLSDAASPTYGQDKFGPTAVILSMTKPNWTKVVGGSVLNQKFDAAALSIAENREKLVKLLQVFFAQGGQEMQFNVVRAKELKAAMEHPEKYANLIVRVSGFSARFTALHRIIQNDILARTLHEGL